MSKKRLHAKVMDIISQCIATMRFNYHKHLEEKKYKNYAFPYRDDNKGKSAYILANGPSLKEEIVELFSVGTNLEDSLVVNFFVDSDLFIKVNPKYYCLADPMFFNKECLSDRVKDTFKALNEKVKWPMKLFIWKSGEELVKEYINNTCIEIIGLSTLTFEGFESNRYKLYKKGIAVPFYVNVTIMAIYALLNLGYSKIYLYGVDHSFLAGLGVNDNNRLCMVDKHFYGTEKYEFEPKMDGSLWTMKEFVYDKYLTFLEHEVMRGYADYLGCEIINCTKDSWIDAYIRKTQLEKL